MYNYRCSDSGTIAFIVHRSYTQIPETPANALSEQPRNCWQVFRIRGGRKLNRKKLIQLQIQPYTKREEWRVIPGHELYEASDEGRIRRESTSKVLSPGKELDEKVAYWGVNIHQYGKLNYMRVHQLVALAFIGECPIGCEVDHIDGNKLNNLPSNLEYVTHAENIRRAILNGQKPSAPIFSDNLVNQVKHLLRQKKPYLTYQKIADMIGIRSSDVSAIYHADRMHYDVPVSREPRSKLTDSDVRKILYLLRNTHFNHTEIAQRFNVNVTTIGRINMGTYTHRAVKKLKAA